MTDHKFNSDWVYRYIRDQLSAGEQAAFEEALLEDTELQSEVEACLAIRETLKRETDRLQVPTKSVPKSASSNVWTSWAMAASVLLAVVSTSALWRINIENNTMQSQIEALQLPRTDVLRVSLDIMRSSGGSTPDAIIRKPPGRSAILLDIELSPRFQELDRVDFSLQREDGEPVFNWSAEPGRDGYASVVLNSESVPEGVLYLHISGSRGRLVEKRSLEFRRAPD